MHHPETRPRFFLSYHYDNGRGGLSQETIERSLDRSSVGPPAPATGAGLIGALRDDAGLLDQAVEHAMKVREERPWRLAPGGGSRQRNESISVERADAATVGWRPAQRPG